MAVPTTPTRSPRPRRLLAAAAATAAAVTLAGCGSGGAGDSAAAAEETAGAGAAFPITLEHAYGSTTIEEKPERIATVAWANHEVPLALGVVPVGMSSAAWGDDDGDGVLPWVEEQLEELGADTPVLFDEADGLDFEAVADTRPDVILAAYSGLTQEDYDTLSKIAPVIAYPEIAWGTSMEDMIRLNSEAIGLAAEGDALIEELRGFVDDKVAEHPELEGTRVLFSWLDPNDLSQIGFYTTHDTRPGFLASIGLGTPAVVAEASAGSQEFYTTISAEEGDRLADVDLVITYGDPDGSTLATIQSDPLLAQIPAIADGAVALLPDSTPLAAAANPSPLSVEATLDDYLTLLSEAVQQ